jgi:hypothetical protein
MIDILPPIDLPKSLDSKVCLPNKQPLLAHEPLKSKPNNLGEPMIGAGVGGWKDGVTFGLKTNQ